MLFSETNAFWYPSLFLSLSSTLSVVIKRSYETRDFMKDFRVFGKISLGEKNVRLIIKFIHRACLSQVLF